MKVIAFGLICLAVMATCNAYWNYPYRSGPSYPRPYYDRYDRYDRYDNYMYQPWGRPPYRPYPIGEPRYIPYYERRPIVKKVMVSPVVIPEPKPVVAEPVAAIQHYMV